MTSFALASSDVYGSPQPFHAKMRLLVCVVRNCTDACSGLGLSPMPGGRFGPCIGYAIKSPLVFTMPSKKLSDRVQ